MNKKYSIAVLCLMLFALVGEGQIVNIPDANFKNALVNTNCVDLDGDGIGDADVDSNDDGEVQLSEALSVSNLFIADYSILSLTGIEAFLELEQLYCEENELSILDLQANTKLKRLVCTSNKLMSLNIDGLSELEGVYCSYNLLSALNIQSLSKLKTLLCNQNKLASLNANGLMNLETLDCNGNQLTTLTLNGLSKLQTLRCSFNKLTSLNLQGLMELFTLVCVDNELSSLDLIDLINLDYVNCQSNLLNELLVENLNNLHVIHASNNQLSNLSLAGLTNLSSLTCDNNQLDSLNPQGLNNLIQLSCSKNNLSELNIKNLYQLTGLNCSDNDISMLDIQGLSKLTYLHFSKNKLSNINVNGLVNLESLYGASNQLTQFDVSGLSKLERFECYDNQISILDLQDLENLAYLYCGSNNITNLFIKNGSIESLLGFANNPLVHICCDANQLQDVQNQANINGQSPIINTICDQYATIIHGNFKKDTNLNCKNDPLETALPNRIIRAEKTNTDTFYAITNSNGYYQLGVDTGDYRISAVIPNNYYGFCQDTQFVSLPQINDTVTADFLLQPLIDCPLLEVNITSSIMRRCFQNTYYVQYCNMGPAEAPNAQVTVTLSDDVEYIGSSIPGTHIGGTDWQFSLGNVASEACGSFTIDFLVLCDSTVLGQTICATAHITPDSICIEGTSPWSGAQVMVDGHCEGDSVRFVIRNVGTGAMTDNVDFVIIEDVVIFRQGSFNLPAQDSIVIKVPANGSTYRLTAGQEPTFPFPSMPSASVEGCGQNLSGLFSLGFVSQFNEDDGNPFYSVDCREIVGSYDPNDKSATPIGVGSMHYIYPETPIDYQIRFQNTGTDTAFTVIIRDTLSPWLDMESLKVGISDHNFRTEIEGGEVLVFIFENILLPDSFVNEPLSHGFLRYTITPKSSMPLGNVIENRAGIYFDFNDPIITNTVFHTVDTGFLEVKLISLFSEKNRQEQHVYPNPVRSGDVLHFENIPQGRSHIALVNPLGKVVFEAHFDGNRVQMPSGLGAGLYFLEWRNERGAQRWGRILVR